jgi:hypothetical protein
MPRKKKCYAADAKSIIFFVTAKDKAKLALIEAHCAKEAKLADAMDFPSADVLRHCLNRVYHMMVRGSERVK